MYSFFVLGFLAFLIFTLVYPYIYLKPIMVIKVTCDSARIVPVEYRFLKRLNRYRLGEFICYASGDSSSLISYNSIALDDAIYICCRGRFGKLVSVDPSSHSLRSLLKNISK